MTAPVIVDPVGTTEAMGPEEPTSPVTVESVNVTSPSGLGAALRTAKFDAEPSDGGAAGLAGLAWATPPVMMSASASASVAKCVCLLLFPKVFIWYSYFFLGLTVK